MIEDVRRYVPIAHPDLLEIVKEGMLQRGWIYIRDVDINVKPLTDISTHAFGLMTLDEWIEHRRTRIRGTLNWAFCPICGEGYTTRQAVREHIVTDHPTEEVIA